MNLTLRFQIIVLFFPLPPRVPSPHSPLPLTHLFNAVQLQSLFLFWTATVSPLTYNNSSVFHLDCCFFLSIHFAVEDVVFNRTHLEVYLLSLFAAYLPFTWLLSFLLCVLHSYGFNKRQASSNNKSYNTWRFEGCSYELGGTKVDACGSFP